MLIEHLIYSLAIAIIFGMVYRRITGRELFWLIIASTYIPDLDAFADVILRKLGITVLVFGAPIDHGDFHNLGVLLTYAAAVALLLHPLGIRLMDSFIFASVGFTAHLFEDALISDQAYRFFWPLYFQKFGIGVFNYSADIYGIANREVLTVGLLLVVLCAAIRTAYEGKDWVMKILDWRGLVNDKS